MAHSKFLSALPNPLEMLPPAVPGQQRVGPLHRGALLEPLSGWGEGVLPERDTEAGCGWPCLHPEKKDPLEHKAPPTSPSVTSPEGVHRPNNVWFHF